MGGVQFIKENWFYAKTVDFNNILQEIVCSYDEGKLKLFVRLSTVVLYDIGDECDRVFIIKTGKASVETYIEITDENTYPIVRNKNICITYLRVRAVGKRDKSRRRFYTGCAHSYLETYLGTKSL